MGRPTKYDPSYVQACDDYLDTLNDNEIPLKEDFAFRLGVDDDTLDNWAKVNKDFFGALKRIMQRQKIQLINDGIYGGKEVNPTITKLLLQNNHGMKERHDVMSDNKPLGQPLVPASEIKTNE